MRWVGLDPHKRYITARPLDDAGKVAAVAAHPYQGELIWQARCKTDSMDALKRATLLRAHSLPEMWTLFAPAPEPHATFILPYLSSLQASIQ
jgi:hypothetical protein